MNTVSEMDVCPWPFAFVTRGGSTSSRQVDVVSVGIHSSHLLKVGPMLQREGDLSLTRYVLFILDRCF
jgi:hypothetical protein